MPKANSHFHVFAHEPLSPLGLKVPYWQWNSDFLDFDQKETCQFLLQTEKEIINKHPPSADGGVYLPYSLGARYKFFNFFKFEHPTAKVLQNFIRDNVKAFFEAFPKKFDTSQLVISCWYNVLRKWEKIGYHVHADNFNMGESFLSGHLVVACEDTHTHYYSMCGKVHWKIKNVPGSLTLFPSYVPHETEVHYGEHPRIMLAFDIFFNKECGPGEPLLKEENILPFSVNHV